MEVSWHLLAIDNFISRLLEEASRKHSHGAQTIISFATLRLTKLSCKKPRHTQRKQHMLFPVCNTTWGLTDVQVSTSSV